MKERNKEMTFSELYSVICILKEQGLDPNTPVVMLFDGDTADVYRVGEVISGNPIRKEIVIFSDYDEYEDEDE